MIVHLPEGLLGRDFDFGETTVTRATIEAYATTVGDAETLARLRQGDPVAPPTLCLALHRGMRPEVPLPADCFGIYGGHDLDLFQPLRAGETYSVHARIADVYEKSGRTGALVVVAREGEIRDRSGGVAVRIHERQIVRRRPDDAADEAPTTSDALPRPPGEGQGGGAAAPSAEVAPAPAPIELGTDLGPYTRPATSIDQVGHYVGGNDIREGLFTDPRFARALGYRGIVVPGPMLTAFLEQFVRATLPGWHLDHLSTIFRMPTITGDALTLSGVVSEHEDDHIVCDVVIQHPTGERAVTASARLRQGKC